jgi:hypothetical protein
MCDWLEKLEATGNNAMFGDDDINFDVQLERFDVDTGALKEPAVERIFWAWVKNWEEEAKKKNDCVEEARLLTKYKGLVFNDPDSGNTFSVWDRNMEFRRGRCMDGLWLVLVQTSQTIKVVMSLFLWSLEMACELIGATKQKEGVKVLREEMEY